MQKYLRAAIFISALGLMAAGCKGQPPSEVIQVPDNQRPTQEQAATPTAQILPLLAPAVVPATAPPVATSAPVATEKVVDYVKYNGEDGKNALDLLKAKYPGQVQTKVYSGIGEFVQSIGGVAADSKHFWEFFVNGKSSNVGAGSYVTKNGDTLEWKLTTLH